ncbi:unnamed protein product, partial [Protopolystoma xenopodis]
MAKLTDDAGETFENVPSPLSDAGNHDNYYCRGLRTRYVLLSHPDNKTKLRQRGQSTSINRKETATIQGAIPLWSSYLRVHEIIADSSLFQSSVHQVSLKEDIHSLPELRITTIGLKQRRCSLSSVSIPHPLSQEAGSPDAWRRLWYHSSA